MPRRIGLRAAGNAVDQAFDRQPAGRPRQRQRGIAHRIGGEQRLDPLKGAARRNHVAPGADDLLDRLQRATEQNAGGEHGTDRGQPLDHEIGAEPEDERLHGEAQKADHAGIVRRAIARDDLPLERAAAVAVPALQQAGHHAHGLHHLGVAQAHVGEGVVARRRRACLGHRALHAPLAEHGQARRARSPTTSANAPSSGCSRKMTQM